MTMFLLSAPITMKFRSFLLVVPPLHHLEIKDQRLANFYLQRLLTLTQKGVFIYLIQAITEYKKFVGTNTDFEIF